MSDLAIDAHSLAKQYRLGAPRQNLRESLVRLCSARFRRFRARRPADASGGAAIWALRETSFQIRQGEVVGLIGRNGAGKSTLLKILSRITEPTGGYADVHGRIGSLLEVGTGFHGELSGRENIFLNGAILGMKRREIQRKFEEIVEFCQLEKFLDTPVKHYSSGMFVRLAFAVAAHLEPEILLVDEVLAVGDARFQKKCLNKIEDVAHEGRTVIFVSHNMSAVTRICRRAILLDGGRIVGDGPAHQVVGAYLTGGFGTTASRCWNDGAAPGGEICRLRGVRVRNRSGGVAEAVDIREPIAIEIEYDVLRPGHRLLPHFFLWNEAGVAILGALDLDPAWRRRPRPPGRYITAGWIPGNLLAEGTLFVDVAVIAVEPFVGQIHEQSVVAFQVIDSMDGDSARGDWTGTFDGGVRPMLEWTTQCRPFDGSPEVA